MVNDVTQMIQKIFFPQYEQRVANFNKHLAYYTSAATAISILENKKIWMRNVRCMNDYSEINYGIQLMKKVFCSGRDPITDALGDQGKVWESTKEIFFSSLPLKGETILRKRVYITCLSEHAPEEDDLGRLSMWRGYGRGTGVAIVLNPDTFKSDFDRFNLFSAPVEYWDESSLSAHVEKIAQCLQPHLDIIKQIPEQLQQVLELMLLFDAVCIKHPGFHEEKEWRIISCEGLYRVENGNELHKEVKVVNDIPQLVKMIPLTSKNKSGDDGFSILENLYRIIIGPTIQSDVIKEALMNELIQLGYDSEKADQLIVESTIPFRK